MYLAREKRRKKEQRFQGFKKGVFVTNIQISLVLLQDSPPGVHHSSQLRAQTPSLHLNQPGEPFLQGITFHQSHVDKPLAPVLGVAKHPRVSEHDGLAAARVWIFEFPPQFKSDIGTIFNKQSQGKGWRRGQAGKNRWHAISRFFCWSLGFLPAMEVLELSVLWRSSNRGNWPPSCCSRRSPDHWVEQTRLSLLPNTPSSRSNEYSPPGGQKME